ncbi:putative retrotransposon gag domain, aspartic peptidase domain superfamily [Helianthus annuus]|nr:putative retrotransposon gag domain, aspartic peptidase domain superfamily [Helianthus annuus]
MPHTRSQGPPPLPLALRSSFSSSTSEVRASSSTSFSQSTPFFDLTPKSSPHNSPPPTRPPSPPPVAHMARRTVYDQATTGFAGGNSPITLPEIPNDRSWQIPSYIMTAITNSCQFHGRDDEDAPAHINRITRLCSTFSIEGVNLDARYLQVFPFSLAGRAAVWFDSQPAGTFRTWAGLRDAFLAKYFPPAKASRLRDQIHSFRMEPDESYHLAWERFQTLITRCSQHGLSDWALVEKFYNGLTPEIRARFDTSAGGQLMGKKTVAECNDLFESFAHSDMDYSTTSRTSIPVRTTSAGRGVNQVSLDSSVAAAVERAKEEIRQEMRQELSEIKKKVDRCEVCRGGHDTIDCPTLTLEQIEYIAGQPRGPTNPFNNSNSNWRGSGNSSGYRSSGNPPGFSGQYQSRGPGIYASSGSGEFSGSGSSGQFSSGGPPHESHGGGRAPEVSTSRLEEMFAQMMTRSEAFMKNQEQINKNNELQFKNQQAALLDLQRTVGGIAKQLQEHPPGQFSGNTFPNPANHSVKAISTRSGKSLGEIVKEREGEEVEEEVDEEIEMETPGKVQHRLDPASTAHAEELPVEKRVGKQPVRVRSPREIDVSRLPFPARARQQAYVREYEKFLEMFTQLKVNLPFIEALRSMPKYAKFLKDFLKRKDRIGESSSASSRGECASVTLDKLPEKLTDPGVFTIPCLFGSGVENHALADLGASINLMPYSFYEKLGLGELKPSRMTLSLADKSVKYPRGVVENLLVKVDRFVFPADFVVLDMEADEKVPLIFGRPFLNTAKALIDVFLGTITLRAGDESVVFEINKKRGSSERVEAIASVEGSDTSGGSKVSSVPTVEKVLKPKCGDPPDRRLEWIEERLFRLESRFEPSSGESRVWGSYVEAKDITGAFNDSSATARKSGFGGELRLFDPP